MTDSTYFVKSTPPFQYLHICNQFIELAWRRLLPKNWLLTNLQCFELSRFLDFLKGVHQVLFKFLGKPCPEEVWLG